MRVVIRPHAVVLTPPLEIVPSNRVTEKRAKKLVLEVLARGFCDGDRVFSFEDSVKAFENLKGGSHFGKVCITIQ